MTSNPSEYYKILGLEPSASIAEVKKQYKALVKRYHPDLNPDPSAHDTFVKITEAYEMLLNPPKRAATGQKQSQSTETTDEEWFRQRAEQRAKEKAEKLAKLRYQAFLRRQRIEKEQNESYSQAIITLFSLLIIGGLVYWGINQYHSYKVHSNPVKSAARVIGISEHRVVVEFKANGDIYEGRQWVTKMPLSYVGDNGIPLVKGQVFEVIFCKDDPSYFEINFNKPNVFTLKQYKFRVTELMFDIFPEKFRGKAELLANTQASCLVNRVYDQYGLEGLSLLIHHDQHMVESLSWNSYTFDKMVESEEFKALEDLCM